MNPKSRLLLIGIAAAIGPCPAPQWPSASSPTLLTGDASSVTSSSAILHGTVNPNGAATHYRFEWGLTTAYGAASRLRYAGSGTTVNSVQATIGDLLPGTIYHYRVVASNKLGDTSGDDRTFTTKGHPPPGAATGPATADRPAERDDDRGCRAQRRGDHLHVPVRAQQLLRHRDLRRHPAGRWPAGNGRPADSRGSRRAPPFTIGSSPFMEASPPMATKRLSSPYPCASGASTYEPRLRRTGAGAGPMPSPPPGSCSARSRSRLRCGAWEAPRSPCFSTETGLRSASSRFSRTAGSRHRACCGAYPGE